MIEFYFGSSFSLGSLRDVLGLLSAAILGTTVSGIGGTVGYVLFLSSTTPVLTIWYHWFASDALGIVTVAPLLIGLFLRRAIRRRGAKLSKALWRLVR